MLFSVSYTCLSIICTRVFAYLNTEVFQELKIMFPRTFSLSLDEGSPVLCCCCLEGEKLPGHGLNVPRTVWDTGFAVTGVSRSLSLVQSLGCVLSQHKNVTSE